MNSKPSVAVLAVLLITGCTANSETAATSTVTVTESSPATSSPATSTPVSTGIAPATAVPSFDCAAADSEAEKLVCRDPALAELDRRLADTYRQALDRAGVDADMLESEQNGWVSGRDDCWKEGDGLQECVQESYLTRLTELQIADPATPDVPTVTYNCPGDKPLTAKFYPFDPPAGVLTWGTDRAIIFQQPTGSGIEYGRDGVEFDEHQGRVEVDFYDNEFVCTTP